MEYPDRLPGDSLTLPLAKIALLGRVVEFRFSDGAPTHRSVDDLRAWLYETDDRAYTPATLLARIEPQYEPGDVVTFRWKDEAEKRQARVTLRSGDPNRGVYFFGELIAAGPEDGIIVRVPEKKIVSVRKPAVEPSTPRPRSQRPKFCVIVERPEPLRKGQPWLERIYAGLYEWEAKDLHKMLLGLGVSPERITLQAEHPLPNRSPFGVGFADFDSVRGRITLWALRRLLPGLRRRRCTTARGNPKVTYQSRAQAAAEIYRLTGSYPPARDYDGRIKNTYYCRQHNGWHVGSAEGLPV